MVAHGIVGEGERAAETTEASPRETTTTAPSTPPSAEPKPEGPQGQGRGRVQASRGKPGGGAGGRPRASAAHEKLEREKPSDDSIVRRWRRNDLKKARPWYRTIYEEWVEEHEYDREHRASAASSASALAAYYEE
jgi:hypothetical protein